MPTYLKTEELQSGSNHTTNFIDDIMKLSMLALALSPVAILLLALYTLNAASLSEGIIIASAGILLIALPQFIHCLLPNNVL